MPRSRTRRSTRGGRQPSTFALNPAMFGGSGGRQSPVFNPGKGRGPNVLPRTPETAPYASMAGPPPQTSLTPNVQAFAPSGPAAFDPGFGAPEPEQVDLGFDTGPPEEEGGSSLVDAIMQEEQPPAPEFPGGTPDYAANPYVAEYGPQDIPASAPGESPYFPGSTFEGSLPSYDPTLVDVLTDFQRRRLEGYR